MGFREFLGKNHGLMMILCCGLPLLLVVILITTVGITNKYVYWSVLLLCPLMHIIMMALHSDKGADKKGGCH
ncbi:DUF2933 domain-containing protein [Candidatus Woesearchaeota archaeon]|nr:DUF2933 domain-containing protein [Candidatus Woesearchaeota archaeon]